MASRRRSFGPFACALALFVAAPRIARADDAKTECAAAYEQAQVDRAAGKLKEARATLAMCLQLACPEFIQVDCGEWRTEVERALPTIVVAARNASGADVISVRVSVDGEPVTDTLDGKDIAINPGRHGFRFETVGAEPVTMNLLVRQGEKNRVIDVRFPSRDAETAPGAADGERALAPEHSSPGPLRPYAYAAGGVGVVGVAGFAILATLAKGREHRLADSCSPTCSSSDVDGLRARYAVANVSLGIGLLGLASGATLFFLSQPEHPRAAADAGRVHVRLVANGRGASTVVSGTF